MWKKTCSSFLYCIHFLGLKYMEVNKYLQDWRSTVHTFLFLLLLQLFFIRRLGYKRNSLHLFLKFLQFALVHLDTNNTQGQGQRTWTILHQLQQQVNVARHMDYISTQNTQYYITAQSLLWKSIKLAIKLQKLLVLCIHLSTENVGYWSK